MPAMPFSEIVLTDEQTELLRLAFKPIFATEETAPNLVRLEYFRLVDRVAVLPPRDGHEFGFQINDQGKSYLAYIDEKQGVEKSEIHELRRIADATNSHVNIARKTASKPNIVEWVAAIAAVLGLLYSVLKDYGII